MRFVLPGAVLLYLAGIALMVISDRIQEGVPLCILALVLYMAARLNPDEGVKAASFRLANYGEEREDLGGDQKPAPQWVSMLGGSLFRLTWPAFLFFLARDVVPVAGGWLMGAVALAGAVPLFYCLHLALIVEVEGARVRRIGPLMLVSNMYPPSIHSGIALKRVSGWKFFHPSIHRAVGRLLARFDGLEPRQENVNFEGQK